MRQFCLLLICNCIFLGCVSTEGKKILYVNSYHKGYPPSDEVTKVIEDAFSSGNHHLELIYFDSKRDGSEEHARRKTDEIISMIETFVPDAVILSDDNAVKSLVPYLMTKEQLPVVFCGVNWSCEEYGLPSVNITGMLEVLPIEELLKQMKELYPECKKLSVITENSLTEQNGAHLLAPIFHSLDFVTTYTLVDNFDEWKNAFITANENSDLIYLPTNGAIKDWNTIEAKAFVTQYINKPIVTCDDFMMPYCVLGMTKVAAEQGEFVVATIKQIFSGKSVVDIPVTKNKKSSGWINQKLASKIDFRLHREDLKEIVFE